MIFLKGELRAPLKGRFLKKGNFGFLGKGSLKVCGLLLKGNLGLLLKGSEGSFKKEFKVS